MSERRVLFALRKQWQQNFLADPVFESLPPMTTRWLELDEADDKAWLNLLEEFDPEVIVGSWWTPRLPERYVCFRETALRYVCYVAGSVRAMVPREMIERGLLVTNWGAIASATVAEHAVLLTLAALRNMAAWRSAITAREYDGRSTLKTRSLEGKRVGIHGFGGVARGVAARLKAFGVELSAYSVGVPSQLFAQEGVREAGSLRELFASSDILIECEALTATNRGCVTDEILRCLPHGAVFVNVGRAAVVDENALIQLGRSGAIRLALDVFHQEPLASDHPFLGIADAILSPHVAGPTFDMLPECGANAMRNLASYLAGDTSALQGIVGLVEYDRST